MGKVLYGEILEPETAADSADATGENPRAERVRHKFWSTFRKAARYIPFADELVAAYFCALDPATPTRVRAILIGALVYFIMPIDAIPDFIAGIGFTDDVTVLIAAITLVRGHITPAHREAARHALGAGGN